MATITLTSSEGNEYTVDREAAIISFLIKEIIEDDENDITIPLPNVNDSTLTKVIEFMVHYSDEPMTKIEKPLRSSVMEENVSEWYAKFVDIEQEQLFNLILAANYMDISSLLNLSCAKVASLIKGKSPQEIRNIFNIENDFTTDEQKRICDENKWCEEI